MKTAWPFATPAAEVIAEHGELPNRLRKRRAVPLGKHLAEVMIKAKKRFRKIGATITHVERGGEDLFALIPLPSVSLSDVEVALGVAKSLNPLKPYTRYYLCGSDSGGGGFVYDRIAANRLELTEGDVIDPVEAALTWTLNGVPEMKDAVAEMGDAPLSANKRSRLLFEAVEKGLLAPSRMYAVSQDYRAAAGTAAWDLIRAFGRVTNAKAPPSDQFEHMFGFLRLVRGRMAERAA